MDKETRDNFDEPSFGTEVEALLHANKEFTQTITRQAERIAELKCAMDDLLGSPMGAVPKSAEKFYDSKSGRFAARKSLARIEQ